LLNSVLRGLFRMKILAELELEGTTNFDQTFAKLKFVVVRWPGFEPGLPAWEAGVLDQARLPPREGCIENHV
jgi:hypothetical protein